MSTDYINANFTSIEDLDAAGTRISELEALKIAVKDIADAKVGMDSPTQSKIVVDNERLDLSLRKVLSVISFIKETDNFDDAISNLDGLLLEFGHVPAFSDLRDQLLQKQEASKNISMLSKAKYIKDLLNNNESNFSTIVEEIKLLPDTPLTQNTRNELQELLVQKVQHKRLEAEPVLKTILTDNKWLSLNFNGQSLTTNTIMEIRQSFKQLIELQAISGTPEYPETWWALDILLEPIVVRFNYHFATANKDTNKLSKPEWALNFMETFLTNHLSFLSSVIGDTFNTYNKIGDYEIISTLLKPLRDKFLVTIGVLNKNIESHKEDPLVHEKSGRLLSHLIFEISSFDQRIRNFYHYNPYIENLKDVPSRKWTGITGDILIRGKDEDLAVTNWLNFENELASKRFKSEILDAKDAFKIDYDYQGSLESDENKHTALSIQKPTYSAYNLVKLFDNLTSHFQTLGIVKYQLKYVSTIQLSLIDQYFNHLSKMFKSFAETFHQGSVLKLIPGGLASDTTSQLESNTVKSGLKSLETLSEIYCLAKYIHCSLEHWSVELIFIQLWNTYKGISIKPQAENLTIFDGSLNQYEQFIDRVLHKYEEFFRKEIKTSLKDYVNSSKWDILPESPGFEASNDLSTFINSIPIYMNFVKRVFSKLDYFLISDKVVSLMSIILYEYVITNNQFSREGVNKLQFDYEYLIDNLHTYLNLRTSEFSNDPNSDYLRLTDSIKLLLTIDFKAAQEFKKRSNTFGKLRLKFDNKLSGLKDNEINDLLLRIL